MQPTDVPVTFAEAVRVWVRVGPQSFGGLAGQIVVGLVEVRRRVLTVRGTSLIAVVVSHVRRESDAMRHIRAQVAPVLVTCDQDAVSWAASMSELGLRRVALLAGVAMLGAVLVTAPVGSAVAAPASTPADIRPEPSSSIRHEVLVLPTAFRGIDDLQRQQLLDEHLHAGLGRASFDVVIPRSDDGCREPACLSAIASAARARYVLETRIDVADRVYRIDLDLIDGTTGRVIVTASETCDVCGISDGAALLADLAASLAAKLRDLALEPPRVEIDTRPPGASALLDGDPIGRTPLERSVTPGQHRLRIELQDYATVERSIVAVTGTRERVSIELRPVARQDPHRRLRVAGWGSFVGALALLGTGSALLVLDGRAARDRCSGVDRDAFGNCRYLHETTIAGAIPTALGIALLGTAIALLVVGRKARGRASSPADRARAPGLRVAW